MTNAYRLILGLYLPLFLGQVRAQAQAPAKPTSPTVYSKEVQQRIDQVEHQLGGWVKIENAPTAWTLAERMKFYNCHGVSIAVIKNYKIEWAKGYGWADSAAQRPVTTATLFLAGSNSKSLNAVGVLKLAQDGKLDLYADINNYLKTWKFPYDSVSKGKKISAANLLSHTGGLTVHGFPGYARGDTIPTITEILDGRRPANSPAIRSAGEPGLQSVYSGGGVTISQLMVEDITGQPYDTYMQTQVLNPLGMTSSFYTNPPPANKSSVLATGYYNDGKPVKGDYHVYPEEAAAGLWTNPTDLAKYVIETQESLAGRSAKVLSPQMTKLRLTPYIDKSAALGVFIMDKDSVKYFRHGGVDEGFVSQYVGNLEGGDGVVVMTNTYNTTMFDEIINSVATVYHWKNYYQPVVKKEVVVPANVLAEYRGRYSIGNDTLSILPKADGCWVVIRPDVIWKMYFSSETDFFVFENRLECKVIRDENKKVLGILLNNKDLAKKID